MGPLVSSCMRRLRAVVLCLAVPGAASACFLGYDSRWGESRRAQQHLAARSGPATIASAAPDTPAPGAGRRTWRVRVRPDAQYLAQNMEAPRRVADLVEDANRVLGPAVAVELVLDRIQPWTLDADDRLEAALTALGHDDPGRDVDLVVGLVGALPRQSDSLHDEGRATVLGKHVVVRGPSRAGERDAIELSFGELAADERARMLKLRQRHRALAVLLHEIGHCLGALHETTATSLMAPAYSPTMNGFDGGAVALMRAALAPGDAASVAHARLAILEGERAGAAWVPAERDAEVARLKAQLAPVAATGAVRAGPSAPSELPADDAERFVRARQLFAGGAVRAAYETAKPLFAAYPAVFAVQELRCELAAVRWLPRAELLAECAGASGADAGH
jgi:hypothetical protein